MSEIVTGTTSGEGRPAASTGSGYPRRWLALTIIAIAQLMVVLDATIVNIALPQAQQDLGISDANRQWVVTAYTLTFGGLLLLGGRIADYWGRKRTFVVGIFGFAIASALGGLAQNGEVLFAARALQGVFGALLAPASLALLTVLFTEPRERAKAFGVYGAIAGGGAAMGLVLGGVLTEYANWRWCLLVNIPVALIAIPLALRLVPESRAGGDTRYDIPGAVLATLGLVSIVYGFTQAAEEGWDAGSTVAFLVVGVLVLATFVVVEARSGNPLLPLRILLDRNRGGAYLASTLVGAGFIGATLFITFYFQAVLRYSPLEAGLASLPLSGGVFLAAGLASQLLPRIGAKIIMSAGAVTAALGMLLLTRIGVDTAFVTHVLPAEIILGFGLGLTFVPLGNVALIGVSDHDAGAASAVVNATQQVGGSLGTALLNTVYTTAVADYLAANRPPTPLTQLEAFVDGYSQGFLWGAVMLAVAAVVIVACVRGGRMEATPPGTVTHL